MAASRRLASLARRAMIYDTATGTRLHTLHGHMNSVSGLNFSPDGTRLATGSGGHEAVKLWDLATGQEVLNLTATLTCWAHPF